jgi:hypothetical protein
VRGVYRGVAGMSELFCVRAKARVALMVVVVPLGDGHGEGDEVSKAGWSVHLSSRLESRYTCPPAFP